MFWKSSDFVSKFKSEGFQRWIILLLTLGIVYGVLFSMPNLQKKEISEKSLKDSMYAFIPVTQEIDMNENRLSADVNATLSAYDKMDAFFTLVSKAREIYAKNPQSNDFIIRELGESLTKYNLTLSKESLAFLIAYPYTQDLYRLREMTRDHMEQMLRERYEVGNSGEMLMKQPDFTGEFMPDPLKDVAQVLLSSVAKDISPKNSYTSGKYMHLVKVIGGMMIMTLLLAFILVYTRNYAKEVYRNKQKLLLIAMIFVTTLLISRWAAEISPLGIPVFISSVLIAILVDVNLALLMNMVLTVLISLMMPLDLHFIFMSLISGSFSSLIAIKANKKNRLFLSAFIIGAMNMTIVAAVDFMKLTAGEDLLWNLLLAFLNGVASVVVAIGILPFIEMAFDIITPVKLTELMNPNHVLLKRLLIEAPGTYHHSLMVGNLAEAASDAIGANPFLARAGAYFHDIGKLNRPDFFMENQLGDNPHERLTPNLSALIITAHTNDGYVLATKHKLPAAIKDIIREHHGTGLCAYFYHKAKTGEKGELVKEESFRYSGPKPSSIESAVVMLADSVEAAVRSMPQKTEGKIEGLIRKIIKDKLEDHQLDQCNLTLGDLDIIAKSFLKVFGGYFHEREAYPNAKGMPNKELDANKETEGKESEVSKEAECSKVEGLQELAVSIEINDVHTAEDVVHHGKEIEVIDDTETIKEVLVQNGNNKQNRKTDKG